VRTTVLATAVVAVALAAGGLLLVLLVHRSLVGSLDAAGLARAHDVAALATAGRLNRPGSHAVFLLAASPEGEPVGRA